MRTGSVTERIAPAKRVPAAHFMEASEADHDEVGQVLVNSFRSLDRERFYNSLLDPDYKPEHRLLARISGRLASRHPAAGVSTCSLDSPFFTTPLPP